MQHYWCFPSFVWCSNGIFVGMWTISSGNRSTTFPVFVWTVGVDDLCGWSLLHSNLSPLVTVPVTPVSVRWRTHFGTCEQWHNLKTLALCSPEYVLHVPWRHILQIIPEKYSFSIGAGPQYLTRANHWDPQKRARPLALCHRTTPAPAKFSNDFC